MRKIYQPLFLLLVVSILIVLCCVFASTPETAVACTAGVTCTNNVPNKATELLWESFSQQFVSAISSQ